MAAVCQGVADHPRIRGEHHLDPVRRVIRRRIIPAYAGSTWQVSAGFHLGWDHPRIRGEHKAAAFDKHAALGSSPHTRGARLEAGHDPRRLGIIPAYAGSTPDMPWVPAAAAWIIPAYAGSTNGGCLTGRVPADHPRIRGEHLRRRRHDIRNKGSSPHTRGAPRLIVRRRRIARIIPAYAGSTVRQLPVCEMRQDHPRIRGEHVSRGPSVRTPAGSSPHTRGARFQLGNDHLVDGIIPAYAGSTPWATWRHTFSPDHPRIRGEHSQCPGA